MKKCGNIGDFYERAVALNDTLATISSDIQSGSITWMELTKKEDEALFAQEVINMSQDSFGQIEENMQDYDGLIYDGPFSEHMNNIEPKGLGDEEFNEVQAEQKIYDYIDKEKVKKVDYKGETLGNIRVHNFDVTLNDDSMFYINVSLQGGKVIWFMQDKQVSDEKISEEEAITIGKNFLDAHGIYGMKDNYYITQNGTTTINFAYVDGDVICYPDLIKVKVALDTGEVVGIEAKRYYTSHMERNLSKPLVSIDMARNVLNSRIQILSEGLAIIPTEWSTEKLAYEFKGRVDEKEFIVYVDAKTGKEEKIFMIVNTPGGTMTM